ncbi:putative Transcription factor [Zostera marina]|uniref:Putative Transcription factor n=1 Tax=Zostera marina TaxID=29655 RepID=A0A0K9Q253_ZOSMR|nr:putative Transcription factor [Zostera marina]
MASSSDPQHPVSTLNPVPRPKKNSPPGQAWSEHETSHLIGAYQDMWYSLRRGPLKSHQWDEVAASLSSRCGYGSRTGTQCRHKMEKLRKRYRIERGKLSSNSRSYWVHYDQMELMESGPHPISVCPPVIPVCPPKAQVEVFDNEDEEDDENESEEDMIRTKERVAWKSNNVDCNYESVRAAKKLVSVVKRFAEGLYRIEKRKMDMMTELERDWMDMELKRQDMWMRSGNYLANKISSAFRSSKKAKKASDI